MGREPSKGGMVHKVIIVQINFNLMAKERNSEFRFGAMDRGATPYFHGRLSILMDFREILSNVRASKRGTIHLIYGAPGSGKSALLDQCKTIAVGEGWDSVYIGVDALWDPDKLLNSLDKDQKYLGTESIHQVGIKGIYSWMRKRTRPQRTVKSMLEDRGKPLLLLLDEAQVLGYENVPPIGHEVDMLVALDFIHNGKMARPIVLLAAGVGTSLPALEALNISRFGDGNTVELGELSEKSARAVIRDWIIKDGLAKGDPTEWIDAIEKDTYRWPRHVHSYAIRAGKYLRENDGVMTSEGLREVMEKGMRGRIQYYRQRVKSFYVDEVKHLAKAISGYPAGIAFDRLDILSPLSGIYGEAEAKKIFDRFMEKGVIAAKGEDGYVVPLPSMHSWLIDAYVKGRNKDK